MKQKTGLPSKTKKPDTAHYLTELAEIMTQFRVLHQLHGIKIVGVVITTTCPFCGEDNFTIRLKDSIGTCGRCQNKLTDFKQFEKYYLIYLEQAEEKEQKRQRYIKGLMKPKDIIY